MELKYMERALVLAEKGRGRTAPNPLVGAVLVKEGEIIGEGWHEAYGKAHGEINAIQHAAKDVAGSDLYVTLEPCAHYGKTPPCVLELIKRKIKRVYIGLIDPNPLVAGKGIKLLQQAGIEVQWGICETACKKQNAIFLKYIQTSQPYVLMKSAMTLDGKIAAYTGDAFWITGEEARGLVQKMRNSLTAIMTGIQTVLMDNPQLTVRIPGGRNPIRIIADSRLRISETAKVLALKENDRCIIAVTDQADREKEKRLQARGIEIIHTSSNAGHVDLRECMAILGEKKIDSILLEGGGELNAAALQAGIVDKAAVFIAPKFIGGREAKTPVEGIGIAKMCNAIPLTDIELKQIGQDVMILGNVGKEGV